MTNEFTVRIEDDEDGIWVLRENADTGERRYMLMNTAGDMHRDGYIFFQGRWKQRPSRGGALDKFLEEIFSCQQSA